MQLKLHATSDNIEPGMLVEISAAFHSRRVDADVAMIPVYPYYSVGLVIEELTGSESIRTSNFATRIKFFFPERDATRMQSINVSLL